MMVTIMNERTDDRTGMPRRRVLKTFALGTATTLVGTPWIGTLLVSLLGEGRAEAANEGQIILQLSKFPALLNPFGSVRLSVDPLEGSFPNGNFYPIVVTRGSGNTFYGVDSSCPHR